MHPLRHLRKQFVKCFGVFREEISVLLHELFELRIFALFTRFDHAVQGSHHVLHARHVFGRHVLHPFGHLVDELLHHLFAQFVHQFFETLLCFIRLEVVVLHFANHAGEIVRHHVEAEIAFHRCIAGRICTPFIP